jgi:hypothetical protein
VSDASVLPRGPCLQCRRLRHDPQILLQCELRSAASFEATADGSAREVWRGAPLTLGNEIDKLASNIALGRDAAGVHYRSDSMRGLFVGEQQALGLLRDYSRTYNERFDGFIVKKFNGDRVRILDGEVRPL